jgi:hypothetical protein
MNEGWSVEVCEDEAVKSRDMHKCLKYRPDSGVMRNCAIPRESPIRSADMPDRSTDTHITSSRAEKPGLGGRRLFSRPVR